jgi:two-component system KDP operon response regulator KdpE
VATKGKIMLVDDEPSILKVLSIKLRVSGYQVISALNGDEALKLIKSEKPDVVLLDVIMPGMDGFEVLQKLRAFSKLPVIVVSARPEYSRQAMTLGANAFIAKPFDIDELLKKIEQFLNLKSD